MLNKWFSSLLILNLKQNSLYNLYKQYCLRMTYWEILKWVKSQYFTAKNHKSNDFAFLFCFVFFVTVICNMAKWNGKMTCLLLSHKDQIQLLILEQGRYMISQTLFKFLYFLITPSESQVW